MFVVLFSSGRARILAPYDLVTDMEPYDSTPPIFYLIGDLNHYLN